MENTTPYSKSNRHRKSPRRTLQARPSNAWPFFNGRAWTIEGFTLVELLVVMSIVMVLAALLVSALRLARAKVRSTVCQSNLRQLSVEFATYDAENGSLPYGFYIHDSLGSPPGGRAGDRVRDPGGWWWFHLLGHPSPHPYISQQPSILYCPSDPITESSLKYNSLYGNYGVNWSLCRGLSPTPVFEEFTRGKPMSLSRLSKASEILLIVDSGYTLISWYHVTDNPPSPLGKKWGVETSYLPGLGINHGRDLLSGQKDDALDGRHPNQSVNIGLADGHIDRRAAESLLVTKTKEGYTNLHPLWRPTSSSGP